MPTILEKAFWPLVVVRFLAQSPASFILVLPIAGFGFFVAYHYEWLGAIAAALAYVIGMWSFEEAVTSYIDRRKYFWVMLVCAGIFWGGWMSLLLAHFGYI